MCAASRTGISGVNLFISFHPDTSFGAKLLKNWPLRSDKIS